ncbi:MAG: tetratricopeptide repeat protein [Dysgonamonadaceae bacterium]|nr:tetratricopeptide repeat protein [Dysgonamonadaceae bacterium]
MNKTAGLALLAVMICANVKAQDMDAILAQADSLSKAGNYADAIALLEKNIKLFETGNPEDALAYSRLGDLYYDLKDFRKAIPNYRKYVDIRKPYAEQEPGRYAEWLYKNMALIGQCQSKLNDYPAAIKTYIEVIVVLDKYKSDIKDYLKEKANKYGSLAWYHLFNKEFENAELSAKKGLEPDGTQTWIKTNLAHALLLQGKSAEAEKIYNELANTTYNDEKTYCKTLLDDFELLEKADIVPDTRKIDIVRIKANLENKHKTEMLERSKKEQQIKLIKQSPIKGISMGASFSTVLSYLKSRDKATDNIKTRKDNSGTGISSNKPQISFRINGSEFDITVRSYSFYFANDQLYTIYLQVVNSENDENQKKLEPLYTVFAEIYDKPTIYEKSEHGDEWSMISSYKKILTWADSDDRGIKSDYTNNDFRMDVTLKFYDGHNK